jgi:putative ABC transport system permease protein
MFKLNLKIALRNLLKHKFYTLINIMGLSIGMASCLLIFIFIRYQYSFDSSFKHKDRIVRFVTDWKYNSFDDFSSGSPIPVAAAVREELPEFEKVGLIAKRSGVIQVKDEVGKDKIKQVDSVYFAQPQVLDILSLDWIAGRPAQEFDAPNTVVLSAAAATRYFGSPAQALGKSFVFWTSLHLKVVAVFKDLPANTSIPVKVIISFPKEWEKNVTSWDGVSSSTHLYGLVRKGQDEAALQLAMSGFNTRHFRNNKIAGNQTSVLQKLEDIHFNENYKNFAESTITTKEIYGLGIIGVFVMITACINFINLATAQSIGRSKEVGVRKVMGSDRRQLMLQFLTETFVITVISLLLASILSELTLPAMQNLIKSKLVFSLFSGPVIFVFMLLLVLFVSFLAGFYPAMVMSGFSPALAIKNKVTANNSNLSLRKILVVIQFAITVILIISTVVIVRQMQYVRERPLGFNTKAITMVDIPGDSLSRSKMQQFRARVLQVPGIKMASFCMESPMTGGMNSTDFSFNGQENKDFEVRVRPNDEHFFKLFNLNFVAGKVYAKSDTINGYVTNETFLRKVGITDPAAAIGKLITQGGHTAPIVGVVKDFNDKSLKEAISPSIFYANKGQYYMMAIQLDKRRIMPAIYEIERLWNSCFPDAVFNSLFVDDNVKSYYETEKVMGVLFRIFAGVIIFISFIGLFGLISFVATQRTREIAIRKVLGASTMQLVKMLNGSFILMVFVANIAAWPLAYILVQKWLSTFAYRMELSIWPFLLAMGISMLITLITVSIRSYRAVASNTIDALKYE